MTHRQEEGPTPCTIEFPHFVPHFEKMLYDNTQFILLLSKYCKINNEKYFKEKLEQTIEFLRAEFLNKDKLLGSAYDADSEGEEGKFYVWTEEEVDALLTDEKMNAAFKLYYDVSNEGNWEEKNILNIKSWCTTGRV